MAGIKEIYVHHHPLHTHLHIRHPRREAVRTPAGGQAALCGHDPRHGVVDHDDTVIGIPRVHLKGFKGNGTGMDADERG